MIGDTRRSTTALVPAVSVLRGVAVADARGVVGADDDADLDAGV
jgi:hypothetical protein